MANGASAKNADGGRLDVASWTEAALTLLGEQGIDGVRVELLAKRLNVTKGSFYWHFKDRDALHQAMLEHWRKMATLALIERLDRGEKSPEARFRRLMRLPLLGRGSARAANVELAIRMWGRRDTRAFAALESIDQLRLRYIARILIEYGARPEDADAGAILAYSYIRVAATLLAPDALDMMARCEDIVLGRVERAAAT